MAAVRKHLLADDWKTMDNPYVGTEWESSWTQGYEAGVGQPLGIVDPPQVLEPNQIVVFTEGVFAGQEDAARSGSPIDINPVEMPEPENKGPEFVATAVFAFAGWATEWAKAEWSGGIGVAVHLFIAVMIPNGEPQEDLSDPSILSTAMHRVIRSMGVDSLYLAFCQNNQHSLDGDQISAGGYWHSNVFTDFWTAYQFAESHLASETGSLGEVGVVRATVDSEGVDWMEVT